MAGGTPSSTTRGREWLSNFPPEDQAVAQTLLDSIKFAQLSTMRQALQSFLWKLMNERQITAPAMIIPALSVEDLPALKSLARHVAFQTFSPGSPISPLPGSEGFVSNIIRDLLRSPMNADGTFLPPTATLDVLREERCRSIILITDYSGSGSQVLNHAMTFVRHPTIRSWRSGGRLRIHAAAYAAAPPTFKLTANPKAPLDGVWSANSVHTLGNQSWTPEMRQAILLLCQRYTNSKHRREEFGYRSSGCLFATEANAPNNLPYILRKHEANWLPFFEGRMVPPELASELGDYTPEFTTDGLVASTGQIRLAAAPPSRHMRHVNAELLKVLALLRRRKRTAAEVAALMGHTLPHTEGLFETLSRLALIDEHHALTLTGIMELAAGKHAAREVSIKLKPGHDAYYPSSMR